MELAKRKRNRLENYDYSIPGYYFITICTLNKEKRFWENEILTEGQPHLSAEGKTVEQFLRGIPEHYPFIALDHYVVMPNHIHLILQIAENNSCPISLIIGQLKRNITMAIHHPVWQKSFHDHVIRGEQDYQKIWLYIEDNPRKWNEDCFYI